MIACSLCTHAHRMVHSDFIRVAGRRRLLLIICSLEGLFQLPKAELFVHPDSLPVSNRNFLLCCNKTFSLCCDKTSSMYLHDISILILFAAFDASAIEDREGHESARTFTLFRSSYLRSCNGSIRICPAAGNQNSREVPGGSPRRSLSSSSSLPAASTFSSGGSCTGKATV